MKKTCALVDEEPVCWIESLTLKVENSILPGSPGKAGPLPLCGFVPVEVRPAGKLAGSSTLGESLSELTDWFV